MKALLFTALTAAHAWVDNGHMLVSEIARQDLDTGDANYITQIIQSFELDPTNNLDYDIVTAAVWPDHIKCQRQCLLKVPVDLKVFDTWHYSDVPYNPDNLDTTGFVVANATGTGDNSAVWLLGASFSTLRSSKNLLTWNFLLRFIIHVLGDLHQPLHAVTGFFNNSQFGYFPNGDRGGNDIKLDGNIDELHLWWDMVGGKYPHSMPVPLTGRWKDELTTNASNLMSAYPRSYFGGLLDQKDYWDSAFRAWADESWRYAANTTYQNIAIHTTPSDAYYQATVAVCEPRIALAGYRLADMLRKVLEKKPLMEDLELQRKVHMAEREAAMKVRAEAGGSASGSGSGASESGSVGAGADEHVRKQVQRIRTTIAKALKGHANVDDHSESDIEMAMSVGMGLGVKSVGGADASQASQAEAVVGSNTVQQQKKGEQQKDGGRPLTFRETWAVGGIGAVVGVAMAGLVALVVYAARRARRDPMQYVEVERDPLLPAPV